MKEPLNSNSFFIFYQYQLVSGHFAKAILLRPKSYPVTS